MEQEKNRLSIQISNYEQRIVDAVRKSKEFAPLELLEMQKTNTGKLSPAQQTQYNELKQSLDLAIKGAQARADQLREQAGISVASARPADVDALVKQYTKAK
jgi:hypothetical protein